MNLPTPPGEPAELERTYSHYGEGHLLLWAEACEARAEAIDTAAAAAGGKSAFGAVMGADCLRRAALKMRDAAGELTQALRTEQELASDAAADASEADA